MNENRIFLNVEIKASCNDLEKIRQVLNRLNARSVGTDLQTDTYFNVNAGRLKLREGNIENNLIFYDRENKPGPKNSSFQLLKISDPDSLKTMLTNSMGIKMVVNKKREIYFIDNVKIHLDMLEELGSFVEIEASNLYADLTNEQLMEQCNFYIKEFGIIDADLIQDSYSDMMLRLGKTTG
jgi:adenylate cyclase, class 2